jgi:ankyrin repeat protein
MERGLTNDKQRNSQENITLFYRRRKIMLIVVPNFQRNMLAQAGALLLEDAAKNFVDMSRFRIWQGADVNVKDEGGDTPLHKAALYNSDVTVLEYLVSIGANVDAKNNEGRTPLDVIREDDENAEVKKRILREAMAKKMKSTSGRAIPKPIKKSAVKKSTTKKSAPKKTTKPTTKKSTPKKATKSATKKSTKKHSNKK